MRGYVGKETGPQTSEASCYGRKGGTARGSQSENEALAMRNRKG